MCKLRPLRTRKATDEADDPHSTALLFSRSSGESALRGASLGRAFVWGLKNHGCYGVGTRRVSSSEPVVDDDSCSSLKSW